MYLWSGIQCSSILEKEKTSKWYFYEDEKQDWIATKMDTAIMRFLFDIKQNEK